MGKTWTRDLKALDSGENLRALEPVDLSKIHSFRDLLEAMGKTAFSARQLGSAYDILYEAFSSPNTMVVMTLSGAMTIAKQTYVICDLIERGCVDILISTGALLTHGLIEGMGIHHYQCPSVDDAFAYQRGFNRIYDTIELEVSLCDFELIIKAHLEKLVPAIDGKTPPAGSSDFCRRLGKLMDDLYPNQRNILSSAVKAGVPVYIPAFTDCEMGLDVAVCYIYKMFGTSGNPFEKPLPPPFNPYVDLMDYNKRIAEHDGSFAIFTIGGGVPRNWAQQASPLLDMLVDKGFSLKKRFFSRGVRICPEPVHWGGLSGCTYSEGISWGKFLPKSHGGKYAEVFVEASAVLPLLVKAIFERMDQRL
jgi:deoxyhypusine synthase